MMSGERRFLSLRVWSEIITNSTKTTVTAAVKTTTTVTSLHLRQLQFRLCAKRFAGSERANVKTHHR